MISISQTNGFGTATVRLNKTSFTSLGTGLSVNDDVRIFEATHVSDTDDSNSSKVYGFHAAGSATGQSKSMGLFADGIWSAGLVVGAGAVTSVTTTSSGHGILVGPDFSIGMRVLDISEFDATNDFTEELLNATHGPATFLASGGRELTVYQATIAPSDNDVSGTFYYAFRTVGASAGLATKYAFFADSEFHFGISSTSENSLFSRTNSQWTTSSSPVVTIENLNTATDANSAMVVVVSNETDGTFAVEMDTAETSVLEGTRNAIGLTNTATNVRFIPTASFYPHESASDRDFLYIGSTSNSRWNAQPAPYLNKYITIPLNLPHGATITEAVVSFFTGGGTGSMFGDTRNSIFELYSQTTGSGGALIATNNDDGTTFSRSDTIVLSLSTVLDNTTKSYFLRYRTQSSVDGTTTTGPQCRAIKVTYTITDLGAAPGF